jgi:hypothetical protein
VRCAVRGLPFPRRDLVPEAGVLKGLFGPDSLPYMLRGGLEEASATQRAIGARVAGTLSASSSVDFSDALAAEAGRAAVEEQLQASMTELADTQLRYEASARLLQEAYSQFRIAMRDHA